MGVFFSLGPLQDPCGGDDHEPLLAFLVPLLAEESGLKVQAFFRQKDLLNETSMTIFSL